MASMTEVAKIAYDAGLRDLDGLTTAVAIAWAESGGNPRAHNRVPPDDSYGLWQINMYGDLGPARRKQFGIGSNDQLFDPATNARAMMLISDGGRNWKPWSTARLKRHIIFMPQAAIAASRVIGNPIGDAADAIDDAADTARKAADAASEGIDLAQRTRAWLSNRNSWVRIAKVGVGSALVIGGLVSLSRGTVVEKAVRAVRPGK